MSQYGDVRFDRVGQRYSVVHYTQTLKAFIRHAALNLQCQTREDVTNIRAGWWLPVERHDPRTRFILACKLAELVKSRDVGFIPSVSFLEGKILQSDDSDPPVWLSSVFSDEEVNILSELWKQFPTAEDFLVTFGDGGSSVTRLLGLSWPAPDLGDLAWRSNWKDLISKVVEPWARKASTLSRFFITESSSVTSGTSGSTAQLSKVAKYSGVYITSLALENGSAISSLATAFPPRCWFDPAKEVDVKLTTTTPVGERLAYWVQTDFK